MTKRTMTIFALAAIIALSAISLAQARGRGNQGMANLTPEKQAAVQKIVDARQDKLFELRQQAWAKNTELRALVESGKADQKTIKALTSEITELRTKMYNERKAMTDQIEAETGLSYGYGRGGGFGDCPGYSQGGRGGRGDCGGQGGYGGQQMRW